MITIMSVTEYIGSYSQSSKERTRIKSSKNVKGRNRTVNDINSLQIINNFRKDQQ